MKEKKLTQRLSMWFEPKVYGKLKKYSDAEYRKMSETIRMLVEEWIEKKESKNEEIKSAK